ncbi:MAG: ComF family protein [Phycisphaeraceae bacterium]|nr:ComF family protein [Phycisphaerales bacterium]MCA9306848.1 ComF family protein [Phycisphaerales bacterium]MCB9844010.1 ComF family protein [Phycisphaeraceae bacterium]
MPSETKPTQAKFTWPPIPNAPVSVAATPAPAQPAPEPRWRAWLRSAERDLLVPTSLPLAQRIADTGWTPDAPTEYCQRCAHSIGPHEPDEFGCANCRNKRPPWSFAVRLATYESHLADWIREVKFHSNRWLGASLGAELARAIRSAGLSDPHPVVIPVPTSTRRRLSRGIDHTLTLARGVASELDAPVVRALARKHRASQLSIPVSARQANVSGSIRAVPRRIQSLLPAPAVGAARGSGSGGGEGGERRKEGAVIVVDDVMTTGSTLRAACNALLEAGIPRRRLWIAILGAAPEPGRRTRAPRGPDVDKDPS